jgi:hypothetical protein
VASALAPVGLSWQGDDASAAGATHDGGDVAHLGKLAVDRDRSPGSAGRRHEAVAEQAALAEDDAVVAGHDVGAADRRLRTALDPRVARAHVLHDLANPVRRAVEEVPPSEQRSISTAAN